MVNFYDTRVGRYVREFSNWRLFNSLKSGEIAIDCGANVGKITRKMARPGVDVYAFEPDSAAFKALVLNTAGLSNVTCFNKAVSDHAGTEKIYFSSRYDEDPEKWSTGSTLVASKPNVDPSRFVMCEVVDLAEFIKSLNKPIGVLKMDIEGEEVKVLNKLIDLGLHAKVRKIVVETHERIQVLAEPTARLRQRIAELKIKNMNLDWA